MNPSSLASRCTWCLLAFLAVGCLLCGGRSALAQTWNLNANGIWHAATNWSPATVPNAVGASATLGTVITANRTITLDAPVTLGTLYVADNQTYTLTGTNLLRLANTGGADSTLTVSNSAAQTFIAQIALSNNLIVSHFGSGNLTLSNLLGTGNLTKIGSGTLRLNGSLSSYSGTTWIQNAVVYYDRAGAVPATNLVIVGDAVGAGQSAAFCLNSTIAAGFAMPVFLNSDGWVQTTTANAVRVKSFSGASANSLVTIQANNLFGIIGGAGDTAYAGRIAGGTASASFDPNAIAIGAVPTGSVTFLDGATVLGTGVLAGSQATLSTASLAVGSHTITAEYAGDSNFNGSTNTTGQTAQPTVTGTGTKVQWIDNGPPKTESWPGATRFYRIVLMP